MIWVVTRNRRLGYAIIGILIVAVLPAYSAQERTSKLVIHSSQQRVLSFQGDAVRLTADNWLNDVILVEFVKPSGRNVSYKLSKDSPVYIERSPGMSNITLRFSNSNMLDFSLQVTEYFGAQSNVDTMNDPRMLDQIVNRSPGMAIERDPDIQSARQHAAATLRIESTRDYERAVQEYERHQYYMGRIGTKTNILANLAGMGREYGLKIEATRRYVASVDQHVTMPSLNEYLSKYSFRLDPKERFVREMYNAYVTAESALDRDGNELFRNIVNWIAVTPEIQDARREPEGRSVLNRGVQARNKGIYDSGGMGDADWTCKQFALKVLVPVFDAAGRSNTVDSPAEAAVQVVSFFSQLGP